MTGKKCGGGPTAAIGRDLHCLPSFEELQLKDNLYLLNIFHVRVRGWGLGLRGGGEKGHVGMEPVVGEERGEGGCRMFGIVVAELRQWKEEGRVGKKMCELDQ